ncbi:MAG: aldehyde dehydrogenase family protein [Rhodoglobus sp.]
MAVIELEQFIGGRWLSGRGAELRSENPSRPSETVAQGTGSSVDDAVAAIESAAAAAAGWASAPAHERGAILKRASQIVAQAAPDWGLELAREEGKTLAEGIGEVRRAAQILEYFGNDADREAGGLFNSPRSGERIFVTRRPLGVVTIITPFNFPIAIPAWKIAPALAYGNTVVWKPAGTVPLLAVRFAQALHEAGLPDGVLNLVLGDREVGAVLVEHPAINGISFTGSTVVGRSIAASAASRGIPVQAEMGGKNAAIVLADADLGLAAEQVLAGAFNSTGQKCTATSRLIVAEAVADEFSRMIARRADDLAVGDPTSDGVRLGPVITAGARDSITDAVDSAILHGARPLTSRSLTLSDDISGGHFVAPTVLDCTGVETSVWTDELFGPVLAVRAVSSTEEAFALANASEFGLSAAVFTNDLTLALSAIETIDVGMLHINSETAGADPHVPFGGAKGSGLGPKEQGPAAREFYTHPTTVYLRGGA